MGIHFQRIFDWAWLISTVCIWMRLIQVCYSLFPILVSSSFRESTGSSLLFHAPVLQLQGTQAQHHMVSIIMFAIEIGISMYRRYHLGYIPYSVVKSVDFPTFDWLGLTLKFDEISASVASASQAGTPRMGHLGSRRSLADTLTGKRKRRLIPKFGGSKFWTSVGKRNIRKVCRSNAVDFELGGAWYTVHCR